MIPIRYLKIEVVTLSCRGNGETHPGSLYQVHEYVYLSLTEIEDRWLERPTRYRFKSIEEQIARHIDGYGCSRNAIIKLTDRSNI